MYLCNNGHDEVCYKSDDCPCCELLKRNIDLEDTIYDLNEEIKKLNEEE